MDIECKQNKQVNYIVYQKVISSIGKIQIENKGVANLNGCLTKRVKFKQKSEEREPTK